MFKLENVNLVLNGVHILKNINLEIKKGERIAFIGHNGAGKSTLVDLLVCIKKPTSGNIQYDFNSKEELRNTLGVQFQTKNFPEGLKVKHLLGFYLDLKGLKVTDKNVQDLIMKFEFQNLLNRPLKKLSGGQKQKFNIMSMLIHNPRIIIVDEIITGLDITSQEYIISLIDNKLKDDKDLTFITISHNSNELEKLVDRIVVLENGKIINDVLIKELVKEYNTLEGYLRTLGKS